MEMIKFFTCLLNRHMEARRSRTDSWMGDNTRKKVFADALPFARVKQVFTFLLIPTQLGDLCVLIQVTVRMLSHDSKQLAISLPDHGYYLFLVLTMKIPGF